MNKSNVKDRKRVKKSKPNLIVSSFSRSEFTQSQIDKLKSIYHTENVSYIISRCIDRDYSFYFKDVPENELNIKSNPDA
jgi:hypothetical protein